MQHLSEKDGDNLPPPTQHLSKRVGDNLSPAFSESRPANLPAETAAMNRTPTASDVGTASVEAFRDALQLMPGGVNSPARAFGAVGGSPLFIDRAEGAFLTDIDGRRFIDYIGSWGPMILGHAHPEVIAAITEAASRGTSYGAPTRAESRLAQQIIEAVPSIDKVRLVNSGTEAAMSAIRVARGATGRDKVIKFAGNYHGHVDSLLVAAGSAAATLGAPDSPGVTAGATADTIVCRYNDIDSVSEAFEKFPGQIAVLAMEPVVGNMGCVPPDEAFLKFVRTITRDHGSLLLFDEVMTGFRLAYGGAQELFGVEPDVTCLGKIVGGGMPLGAYGGSAEVMDQVLPAGKVFQAGTLSGNPVAVAAGSQTLEILQRDPPYQRLDQLGQRLADGLDAAATDAGIEHVVQRVGSMITLFFNSGPVRSWDDADRSDRAAYGEFFWGMIRRGIYFPCSQFEALFFSNVHTEAMIDQTIAAAGETLREMRR